MRSFLIKKSACSFFSIRVTKLSYSYVVVVGLGDERSEVPR